MFGLKTQSDARLRRVSTLVVAALHAISGRLGATKIVLLAMVCLAGLARPVHAEKVYNVYRNALQAYYAGHYGQSVEKLERLVALPLHNENLFYNLGNAYYRSGKLGYAIYNYERALALAPDFDDARYNLEIAQRAARAQIKVVLKGSLKQPWWSRAVKTLSLRGWWTLVIVLWWLVLGLIFLLRRAEQGAGRAALVALNGLMVAGLLTAGLFLTGRVELTSGHPEAIVLPETAAAREGPNRSARETFKLHAGLRVRLQGEAEGWARVRLANGLEGWVERQAVGVLAQ